MTRRTAASESHDIPAGPETWNPLVAPPVSTYIPTFEPQDAPEPPAISWDAGWEHLRESWVHLDDPIYPIACVSLAEADEAVRVQFREAAAWTACGPGRLAILDVHPPGSGKSRAALSEIIANGGTIASPTNALLDELEARLLTLGAHPERRASSFRNHPQAKRLGVWAQRGWPIARWLRERGGSDPETNLYDSHGRVQLVTHAMLARKGAGLPGPLVIDELPPLVETTYMSIADASLLTVSAGPWAGWAAPRREAALAFIAAADEAAAYAGRTRWAVQVGNTPDPEQRDAWLAALAADAGTPPPKPPIKAVLSGLLNATAWVRADLDGFLRAWLLGEGCFVCLEGQAIRFELRRPWFANLDVTRSYIILDATARTLAAPITMAAEAIGFEPKFYQLDVELPKVTVLHRETGALRRALLKRTPEPLTLARPLFHEALTGAMDAWWQTNPGRPPKVAVVAYKFIAKAMREDPAAWGLAASAKGSPKPSRRVLRNRTAPRAACYPAEWGVMTYFAARGLDCYRDYDVLILFGDPSANLSAIEADAETIGTDRDVLAAGLLQAEQDQMLHRLRIVQDAERTRVVVYVGRYAPAKRVTSVKIAPDILTAHIRVTCLMQKCGVTERGWFIRPDGSRVDARLNVAASDVRRAVRALLWQPTRVSGNGRPLTVWRPPSVG